VASGYAIEEARRNLVARGPSGHLAALNVALTHVRSVREAGLSALERAATVEFPDPADLPILPAAIQSHCDVPVKGDRDAFGRYYRTPLAGVEVLPLCDALRRALGLPVDPQ